MKIVVLAGVFDPVHNGHVAAVGRALQLSVADKAVVVAEKLPQHKHGTASYQDRFEMLKLAFVENPKVEVLESPTSEFKVSSFFSWLNSRFDHPEIIWVMGVDVLQHIDKWSDIDKIHELGVREIIAFSRTGADRPNVKSVGGAKVNYVTTAEQYSDISSRKVRENLEDSIGLIDEKVAKYIEDKKLYQNR